MKYITNNKLIQFKKWILSIFSTRYFFTRKDIHRAYLDGRLDELDETKGNMDVAFYLEDKAKEYADSYNGC